MFKTSPRFSRLRKRLLIGGGVFVVAFHVGLFFFIFSFSSFKELEKSRASLPSVVYTFDGKILTSFTQDDDEAYTPLPEMPRHLQKALLAAQDPDFLEADAAPIKQILTTLTGGKRGATLTQQLARIMYERKRGKSAGLLRKMRIVFSTIAIEDRFSKPEIIAHYLNFVTFAGNATGIEQAAYQFFNKKCKDLTAEESALLVGMIKAPTKYNPKRNPQNALKRRNEVLKTMNESGWLTDVKYKKAKETPVLLQKPEKIVKPLEKVIAPYFRDYVRNWVKKWCAQNDYDPYTDGLKIYTTLDATLQKHAEDGMIQHLQNHQAMFEGHIRYAKPWEKDSSILYRAMRFSDRYKELKEQGWDEKRIRQSFNQPVPMRLFSYNTQGYTEKVMSPWDSLKFYAGVLHSGLVSIDPYTGHIKAWVGDVNYDYFKYDHAMQGKRQVGSTFKPFVYATALDNGFEPCSTYLNQPVTIIAPDGDEWKPRNADHDYCGKVSLRYGLVHSVNVVTARLIQDVGPERVIDYARNMGVVSDLKPVPSIALGTFDLSVAELTSAFTTFPNGGVHKDLVFVSRIEDKGGATLACFENEGSRAMSEKTAYTMVELLRGVATYGTAAEARTNYGLPWQLDIGGKTGTTQNNSDGWFVGFTPHLVTGVWVGCEDRSVNFGYSDLGRGSNMALPIWAYYMREVYMDDYLNYNVARKIPKPKDYNVSIQCNDPPKRVKTDTTAVDSTALEQMLDSLMKQTVEPEAIEKETNDLPVNLPPKSQPKPAVRPEPAAATETKPTPAAPKKNLPKPEPPADKKAKREKDKAERKSKKEKADSL